MSFLLDDNATMIRETADRFFADADGARTLRQWRNQRDLAASARGSAEGIAELGFAGILIPEEFGGAGLDSRSSAQVAEAMGKTLASGPFLSSGIIAATALMRGSNASLKAELLPAIATGKVVTLASEEAARHSPHAIATTARRDGDGWRVSGRKIAVIDGNIAETFLVTARADSGILMFAIDAGVSGIAVDAHLGLDSRPLATVTFDTVPVSDTASVCRPDETLAVLDAAYDAGRLHLAAEMLGAAQEAFDRTIEYLKTRVQFGKKIGEFQALQHRAAILFGELEIARSVMLRAAFAPSAETASLAKAKVGEVAKHAAGEAVQMHGGIGVTDDFDMGFYLKRIRAAAELLGDGIFHTERYARLQGL